MTEPDVIALARLCDACPFHGVAPGANTMGFVEIPTRHGPVDGVVIERLVRAGWLQAEPLARPFTVKAAEGTQAHDAELPEMDITHLYEVTRAGLEAIAERTDLMPQEGVDALRSRA